MGLGLCCHYASPHSIQVYRCWIVYGRRWLPIVPSLLAFLLFIAMGIRLSMGATAASIVDRSHAGGVPWRTAVYSSSTFQNILTTSKYFATSAVITSEFFIIIGILIWRIWQVDSQNERYTGRNGLYRPSHLRKVMWVIGESGAVYALMMCACTVISAVQNNLEVPFSYMVSDSSCGTSGRLTEKRKRYFKLQGSCSM